jgi:hypothetical protein
MSPAAALHSLMISSQESLRPAGRAGAADWPLPAGAARRLTIGPGARWLRVSAGQLWLTAQGELDRPADDHWLQAGEQLWLPAGCEVVVEGRGPASFQLLVPAQACRPQGPLVAVWRQVLGPVLHNLRTARPAGPPEIACHS